MGTMGLAHNRCSLRGFFQRNKFMNEWIQKSPLVQELFYLLFNWPIHSFIHSTKGSNAHLLPGPGPYASGTRLQWSNIDSVIHSINIHPVPAGSQVLGLSLGLKLAFPNFMMSSWVRSEDKGMLVQTLKGHGRLPWREEKIEASSRLVLGKDFKSPAWLNCRHPEALGFQRDPIVFLIAMLLSGNCCHLTKPRARKDVEQRDHPATVSCRIKWYNCVGEQKSKSQTARRDVNISSQLQHLSSGLSRNSYTYAQGAKHKNIHCSIVRDGKTLGTAYLVINRKMNE